MYNLNQREEMEISLRVWLMNRGVYKINLQDMNDKELSEWTHFIRFMGKEETQ